MLHMWKHPDTGKQTKNNTLHKVWIQQDKS